MGGQRRRAGFNTLSGMSFFQNIWKKIKEDHSPSVVDAPVEEEKSFRDSFMSMAEAGMEHIAALASLFLVEADESLQRIKCKAVCLCIGLFLLFFGYVFGFLAVTVLLEGWMGLLWALVSVAGFHLVVGGILLCVAIRKKAGPFAPETVNELKSDYECLQIAIKENKS